MITEETFPITGRDVDPFGQCRPSSLLAFMQEAAIQGVNQLHLDREAVEEQYGGVWIVARNWYRLFEPLVWRDRLSIQSWHRATKGASFYRDFDFFCNGKLVGEGSTIWVLLNLQTHTLIRGNTITQLNENSVNERCKTNPLKKLHLPKERTFVSHRTIQYSDCDINQHVNNAKYADFVCDALELHHCGKGHYVQSLELNYLKEISPGETLLMEKAYDRDMFYVSGKINNHSHFDAGITLAPLTKETF